MELVDYYGALRLSRDADAKQIRKAFLAALEETNDPEQFQLCTEAYGVLRNRYKRARYDQSLGFLLIVLTKKESYPSAAVYNLGTSKVAVGFKSLAQHYRKWIKEKYDMTWEEAELANFGYHLSRKKGSPSLLLRFPSKPALEAFVTKAISEKMIRVFD